MVLETQGQSNHRFWHLFGQLVTVAAPWGQIYQGHGQKQRLLTTGWSPLNFNRIYRTPPGWWDPHGAPFPSISIIVPYYWVSNMVVVWDSMGVVWEWGSHQPRQPRGPYINSIHGWSEPLTLDGANTGCATLCGPALGIQRGNLAGHFSKFLCSTVLVPRIISYKLYYE